MIQIRLQEEMTAEMSEEADYDESESADFIDYFFGVVSDDEEDENIEDD